MPREGCPGGSWAWRGRASSGGNRLGVTRAPRGRAGLEPGQQQRQGQQGQQTGVQGGGRAPQRGLVGLSGRRALGAGQAAPGAAQLLQVPLELDLAGLLAQRLPDGGGFHGASRQHLAGAGVEVIPGPGEEGGSRGRCWWQATPPTQRLPQGHSLADGVQLLRLLAALLLLLLPDALGHAVPQADEAVGEALVDGVALSRHADGLLARGCGAQRGETELSPRRAPDSPRLPGSGERGVRVSPGGGDTGL